jgi:methionine sulfoxide reductase heme-binding subunit
MAAATERRVPHSWLKPGVLVGSLVPVAAIVARGALGELGADPIAQALNQLGLVALVFLIAALVCTPLKMFFGWTWPIRLRRMLGVLAFVYAALHVVTYVALDQSFDWAAIFADVVKRKFIFVGFAAFVLIVPLAATSTNASVKRLGFARWKRVHRLAYLAPAFAVLHFVWRVKKDVTEPAVYGAFLAALLLARVYDSWRMRQRAPGQPGSLTL